MRVVVYPHALGLGGSQLNAIELGAAVRDLGHEVVVFGPRGALEQRIEELGLEFIAAPRPRGRPSPPVMRALGRVVGQRRIDVVHGYEWTTALEAYWGAQVRLGVPAVATVMSMAVAPFIPQDLRLVVGTEQIADQERRLGRPSVATIEPPVDVVHNAPGIVDAERFRCEYELDADALTVVCVTRLAAELKLEGLLSAVDAVARIGKRLRIQLVVVGDGPMRALVAERAQRANAEAGRRVVVLTGELGDPRPAYAAADICLGMGGSGLRAMAMGKPLVVQGEGGFWEILTTETIDRFLWTGIYGVGDDPAGGSARLESLLLELGSDGLRREALGAYSRRLVVERFSLPRAAERQLEVYEAAIADARRLEHRRISATGASSIGRLVAYRSRRRVEQLIGRASIDDFNSKPVAAIRALPAGSRG